ncbi:hypothetical protein DFQ09_1114 [Winogradskyella pacifica]|uniref:Uncharacterized protein n=1 Tax=Winogradskyella pacifica TaxID=664642 RepID=A0A3D9LM85_9FLAO|nr:hypothetical protein DFQ09_1114 [Winogradskyella pacifica]
MKMFGDYPLAKIFYLKVLARGFLNLLLVVVIDFNL